jgi:hypothetical protein
VATSRQESVAWIVRVLGVSPAAGSGGSARPRADIVAALTDWDDAQERVNIQITKLQQVLLGSPDSELHDIAEFGLNAMTGNHRVKLQAALMGLRGGQANPSVAGKASGLVASFLNHIASDPRIAACDANPFGVRMSVRQTMVPALEGLKVALTAAARS